MSYSFLKPVKVGNMILKNRVIVPAMARYLCKDGFVTDAYVEYLRAIAEGGVAMVTVGIMPIDLSWPSTMPTQPCLGDDKYIPGITRAAQRRASSHGCPAALPIHMQTLLNVHKTSQ